MTKLAEEYDKEQALRSVGEGIDAWYKRVVRLQRNQEILVSMLRAHTNRSEEEIREMVQLMGGYGEEV